jgi:hypothetical protein
MYPPGGRVAIAIIALLTTTKCVSTGDIQGMVGAAPGWISNIPGSNQTTAETTSSASLTPAEQRLREQSHAFQKTVWEGALVGAGAGTVYGVIRGDKGTDLLRDVLIGGAVGGLAGAYVAHKQEQYSSKEDQLDSMIADVRKSNQETEELIASVRQVIAEDKKRLAAVEQQVRKGQATQADLDGTRRRIADNQAVITNARTGAREKLAMFRGAEQQFRRDHPGANTGGMQRELDTYNKNLATLDGLAGHVAVA